MVFQICYIPTVLRSFMFLCKLVKRNRIMNKFMNSEINIFWLALLPWFVANIMEFNLFMWYTMYSEYNCFRYQIYLVVIICRAFNVIIHTVHWRTLHALHARLHSMSLKGQYYYFYEVIKGHKRWRVATKHVLRSKNVLPNYLVFTLAWNCMICLHLSINNLY